LYSLVCPVSRSGVAVTLAVRRSESYSPGRRQTPLNKAMSVPESVCDENKWKSLAVREIHRFNEGSETAADTPTCQSVGIPSIRLDDSRGHVFPEKLDVRRMTDLAVQDAF
jgi:hypothetical protein